MLKQNFLTYSVVVRPIGLRRKDFSTLTIPQQAQDFLERESELVRESLMQRNKINKPTHTVVMNIT